MSWRRVSGDVSGIDLPLTVTAGPDDVEASSMFGRSDVRTDQEESTDHGFEMFAVFVNELIGAFHRAPWIFEWAEAGVLEELAGREIGEVAHDTFAVDFFAFAFAVDDHPVTAQKSTAFVAFVGHADAIAPRELAVFGLALFSDVKGANHHAESVGGSV